VRGKSSRDPHSELEQGISFIFTYIGDKFQGRPHSQLSIIVVSVRITKIKLVLHHQTILRQTRQIFAPSLQRVSDSVKKFL
jgi:hypothetical protein